MRFLASALSQIGVRTKAKRGGSGGGSRPTVRKSAAAKSSVSESSRSWPVIVDAATRRFGLSYHPPVKQHWFLGE